MRATRDQRGSITPFVVIVSLALILLAALVVDGGRQLNAKGRAIAYAQEAARAGSQAIDVTDPRLDLLPAAAMAAASDYCRQAMAADAQLSSCEPSLTTVRDAAGTFRAVSVTARIKIPAILMGMMGRNELGARGVALARPVSGISEPDSGKMSSAGPPQVAPPGGGTPPTAPPTLPEDSISPCTPASLMPTPTPTPTQKPSGQKTDKPGASPSGSPSPSPTDKPSPPEPSFTGPAECLTPTP